MKKIRLFLFFPLLTLFSLLHAQVSKDATVPMTASLNGSTIELNWANPGNTKLILLRRTKGQGGTQWIQLLNVTASNQTSLTDNTNIVQGATYEYVIQRVSGTINAFGYAHVAVNADVTDSRGKLILYVDADLSNPLASEISRLKDDLRGDGWQVIERISSASSTVQEIKTQIVADRAADPNNVKAVFLLGKIPVPYSGNSNWDGHPDHTGAWPCDAYYADVNGNWTDATVNNSGTGRAANYNLPGDGKFDQSIIPTPVELQVGRVDFRRLNPVDFGVANEAGLYKRYLDKDHNWRIGAYTVENKALVDDNFGYFGGEAFAANGFRNAYPLVGEGNVVETDFFSNSNPQRWLLGYGTGGGTYTSAGGVGSSADFMTDTVNIVFSNLFGSYHGDWDYESNPFMPSALASRGGILTCAWAGRPHWFNQALASGETIGYCAKETQNANLNNGFLSSYGESGAHVSLLGDPSLRAHVVSPPDLAQGELQVIKKCNQVQLSWPASADASGYHVYRALSENGPYTRLSTALLSGTSYTDASPANDTLYYQVRAIKSVSSPGGGTYLNNSVGVMKSYIFTPPTTLPLVGASAGILNCTVLSTALLPSANVAIDSWSWAGPGISNNASEMSPVVSLPGTYTVTATDGLGCTASASLTVTQNVVQPTASVIGGTLTCSITTLTLDLNNTNMNLIKNECVWSGPGIVGSNVGYPIFVSTAGTYFVTITGSNGCTNVLQTIVNQDAVIPVVTLPPGPYTLTCTQPDIPLPVPNIIGANFTAHWNGPCVFPPQGPSALATCPGIYTLVITNTTNGCSSQASVVITQDAEIPDVSIQFNPDMATDCLPDFQLISVSTLTSLNYHWEGPGINSSNQSLANPVILLPGAYSLTVTNTQTGCTNTEGINLNFGDPRPNFTLTCGTFNCHNQSAQLQVSSVDPTLSYHWIGPGLNSNNPSPVVDQPGLYQLTVTGSNGCTRTASCTIEAPADFSAQVNGLFNCEGTLSFSALAIGGTPPYQYLWANGETTQTTTLPLAPPYQVTVTDQNGCSTLSSIPVIIVSPFPLSAAAVIDPVTQNGTNDDGSIDISVSGGTPPYQYLWSNNATTEDIDHLSVGVYSCTVTDAVGCSQVFIFEMPALLANHEASVIKVLNLSPNPASDMSTLDLSLRSPSDIALKLLSLDGKTLWEKQLNSVQSARVDIPLASLPAGLYQLMLQTKDERIMKPLVVGR